MNGQVGNGYRLQMIVTFIWTELSERNPPILGRWVVSGITVVGCLYKTWTWTWMWKRKKRPKMKPDDTKNGKIRHKNVRAERPLYCECVWMQSDCLSVGGWCSGAGVRAEGCRDRGPVSGWAEWIDTGISTQCPVYLHSLPAAALTL